MTRTSPGSKELIDDPSREKKEEELDFLAEITSFSRKRERLSLCPLQQVTPLSNHRLEATRQYRLKTFADAHRASQILEAFSTGSSLFVEQIDAERYNHFEHDLSHCRTWYRASIKMRSKTKSFS